jgi:dihydrolipoamide dehydrogenase
MADKFDVAVIGGGPGGYVAAIKAAQLGKKTVCIEREYWGGVCLNWGCIPSKALIHAAHTFADTTGHMVDMGFETGKTKIDSKKLNAWKEGVVQKMTSGVAQLLKGNKVAMVMGSAAFTGPKTIEVTGKDGKKTIEFDDAIIAVGARPIQLPGFEFDEVQICSARGGVNVETLPKTMTVIGAGIIGLELGTVYAKLGTEVTVIEFMPQAMTGIDADLVRPVQRNLEKLGVKFVFNAKARAAVKKGKSVEVSYEVDGKTQSHSADKVLVAVSFRPNTENVGLDKAGVTLDAKGFIPVNDKLQTNVPRIYAIGDCTGSPLLAHRAMKQGEVAAEVIAGHKGAAYDVVAMPGGAFTDPEIATVGLNETKAKEAGYDPIVGKFFFGANGRAVASGAGEGFVKAVVDRKTHVLLGMHIVGANANDMIAEACVAMELGALADDLALTVHVHPTMSESVHEACKAALGEAIHALNRSAA